MNRHITQLDEITPPDEARSGAKAYNCAHLKRAGFPVPDGLVVLSHAADAHIATVAEHPWFDLLPGDAVFAVRSSGIGEDGAGQSFAGIHQTFLGVKRSDVARAVVACRDSGHTVQALEYRRAKGVATDAIQMGVLIQRMIQPVAAGVAFTINPVTGARDEMVINSSWGIGEALVSGQVDPDEFVVGKRDTEIRWSRIGEKAEGDSEMASLSASHVRELAGILIDIESCYGVPQDVEWCHDGSQFWIVQSRPITTTRSASDGIEWTRANLAEVLPDITAPQPLSAFEDLLNRAEDKYLGTLIAPEEALGPITKMFYGRLYFNLSQMRRICALGGVSAADVLKSMGHAGAIQPDDERPRRLPIGERLSAIPGLVRILLRHLRAARIVAKHDARVRQSLEGMRSDPRALSDKELWAVLDGWIKEAPESMQTVLLLSGVLFHEGPVRRICEKVGFAFERLVYPQLALGARSVSAQQAFDLLALAGVARRDPSVVQCLTGETPDLSTLRATFRGTPFLESFERFLQSYGHRGRYESDWSLPRYDEDPRSLLLAIRAHLDDGPESDAGSITQRQRQEADDSWKAFEKQLSPWQRRTTAPRVRASIRKIKQYYVWREQVRSDLMRILARARAWHLVLAERFVERGWLNNRDEYFLIYLEEVGRVISEEAPPETLRAIATARSAEQARYRALRMPLLMRESELAHLIRTSGVSSRSDDESQLSGYPVSGGCVEAEVVIVRDPGDFGQMKRGAILVAPATDPSWTPLFTLASGVIVEVGGVLSHASTIAREYGLPALANVKHATRRLTNGERVRLDADRGFVYRLQPATAVDETDTQAERRLSGSAHQIR